MGLLRAGIGALSGVLADQWREYFYCESMPEDVLVTKGIKRTSGRSSNTRGEDNIISNGAIIAVNEGQCMMIVEQGAIVEFSAEAGEFVWDSSTEPTIFYGNLSENIKSVWETLKKRFTFGGDTGKDQRIYYFNTKEIIGNKYGTANPIPFRVVDKNIGLDLEATVKCFGEYSYKLANPMLFYKNVCGNVTANYTRDRVDSQMRSEMLSAMQPAFSKISEAGIRYSALPGHTTELCDLLNNELSKKWRDVRGIEMVSMAISSIKLSDEYEKKIADLQTSAALSNPALAAGHMTQAQAAAMQAAASNENAGAFMGFAGMNMAANAGGMNAASLFQVAAQQQSQAQAVNGWQCSCGTVVNGNFCPTCGSKKPEPKPVGWTCSCGAAGNTGKFCAECGKPQPAPADGWACSCGAVNKGKFCAECGAKKPAGAPQYKCDKCGWEPEDPTHPPKFCPECGDPFGDEDIK